MRYLKVSALLAVAILSTGCLRVTYTLSVKPDGSGTVATTLAMTKAMSQQAAAMMAGASGSLFPTEAQMRAQAARMGQAVRFVSKTPYKAGGFEGATALYAFDDVNKLTLNMQQAIAGTVNAPQLTGREIDPKADIKLSFRRQGDRSVIVIGMPEVPKPGDEIKQQAAQAAAKQKQSPEAEAMMKQMMAGMLLEVAVNVQGQILKTNAPYVEGSRLVLLRLDGNEVIKSGQGLGPLMQSGASGDFDRLRKIPGLKIVSLPEVRIEFK